MTPSVELDWQMSATSSAYGFYSLQTGRQHQAGLQPNACTMGNYYFFFSNGTVQTNATGVVPAPPAGTSLVDTTRVVESNYRSVCPTAAANSPLFPTSRTWDVAQKDHNVVGGLGFRYEFGRVLTEVAYTHSNGRTGITYDYDATALGLNATQVALAGDGFSDLVFDQDIAEATAVVPLVPRLSLRFLYRYERAELHDWHYDGIDENPMPANNSAYLDVGPQSYKVHYFGVFVRFSL